MRIKPIALVALVAAALTVLPTATAYASCSLAADEVDAMARVVEEELVRAAPVRPGADPRDAEWLKDHIPAMVPDWLATTRSAVTAGKAEIDRVVDDCYRPGDHSVPGPVRFAFIACAKKGLMSQVTAFGPAGWTAVCDELRGALDAPGAGEKVRVWARTWVDAYLRYAQDRPTT